MAGITDRPFRQLARRFGAGLAVSEMLSSRPELRESRKSRLRRDHAGEPGPISVQIAGADPAMLAEAARYNVDQGAQIIDINIKSGSANGLLLGGGISLSICPQLTLPLTRRPRSRTPRATMR